MLEPRRVSKVYGQRTAGVHALADVSLPVDEGSMVAVTGPSGSGKSTLLTAAGNISLPLERDGLTARKARAAGLRALERLGLGERAALLTPEPNQ